MSHLPYIRLKQRAGSFFMGHFSYNVAWETSLFTIYRRRRVTKYDTRKEGNAERRYEARIKDEGKPDEGKPRLYKKM